MEDPRTGLAKNIFHNQGGSVSDRDDTFARQNQSLTVPQSRPIGAEKIAEVSHSRNEWEETLGESQLNGASHSLKQRNSQPMHGLGNVAMTSTAKVKSSLRSSADQPKSSLHYSEDRSMTGSKTESAYDDDFDSISKSHLSASRQQSRSGGAKASHQQNNQSYSTAFENQTANQTSAEKKKTAAAAGGKGQSLSSKRKSVEVLNENYSPIKEAKHKEEHSFEEEKSKKPSADDDGDEDYSSVENSESTLKHKYSNPATRQNNKIGGSGQKRT